jgi:hypothetical protein
MSMELPSEIRELHETLNERFVAGIEKSFTPCPLIGPRWLQSFPKGKPADFRFFGIRKLSKAIGRPADVILATLMKNVSFDGLDVNVRLRDGMYIDVYRKRSRSSQ